MLFLQINKNNPNPLGQYFIEGSLLNSQWVGYELGNVNMNVFRPPYCVLRPERACLRMHLHIL